MGKMRWTVVRLVQVSRLRKERRMCVLQARDPMVLRRLPHELLCFRYYRRNGSLEYLKDPPGRVPSNQRVPITTVEHNTSAFLPSSRT
jgi:hypothetical protein